MILVTGGTGFVGRHLVSELCSRGQPVRVLTRDVARAQTQLGRCAGLMECRGLDFVQGDVLEASTLDGALAGVDVVVHLAAAVSGAERSRGRLTETNVLGTARVAAAAVGAGVRRFVHGSSEGVYGDGSTASPHREEGPLLARSDYERSKLSAENVARAELEGTNVGLVVLRLARIYGPGGAATLTFCRAILRKALWLHGSSTMLVQPAYIGDVVQAIIASVETPFAAGQTLNIAGERALAYRDLIDLTARLLGTRVRQISAPPWFGRAAASAADIMRRSTGRPAPSWLTRLGVPVINRSLDIALARQVLGFRPASLEGSMSETIAWFRREGLL